MHAIGEPYTSALCTYGNLHRHAKEERIYFRVVIECMVKNEIYSSRKTISRFAGQSSKMTLIIMNALARPHMYDSYAKCSSVRLNCLFGKYNICTLLLFIVSTTNVHFFSSSFFHFFFQPPHGDRNGLE